jgi:hypothetical protein
MVLTLGSERLPLAEEILALRGVDDVKVDAVANVGAPRKTALLSVITVDPSISSLLAGCPQRRPLGAGRKPRLTHDTQTTLTHRFQGRRIGFPAG